jgi:hypothetical protein
MSYLDLNNDAKSIVAKRSSNNMNITTMFMSKHYDFQKILFGEIVFDEAYSKIKQKLGRISDDDDFNNGNTLIRMYVCIYICICTYTYVCMYVYMYMYVSIYVYVCGFGSMSVGLDR